MPQRLFTDFKFRILSVILGVGTWWMISREVPKSPVHTRVFDDIPVHIMVSSESRNFVQLSPDRITVKLRGPSNVLDDLSSSQITAYVRITERQTGVRIILPAIFLSPELVKEGVTVEEVPRVRVAMSPPPQ